MGGIMRDTSNASNLQITSCSNYKPCAGIYDKSRIIDFDQHRKNKERFRNNKLHWEQIPRANNPGKPLQEKAVNILATAVHKLRKMEIITLNHNYLSRITKCAKDQNVNLLKQLSDVLDISFHAKTTINNKIYRNCYVIKHTQKGRDVIENPKVLLAQKHFVGNKAVIPVEELSAEGNKDTSCAEFFPPFSIYKEEVLENNRSMKSNFLQNSFFKKEEGREQVKHHFTPTPPQLKAPDLQLKDFYPLSKSDADYLQVKSGRAFSLNAMNEILLSMSKRVSDRWFKSKKGFLSYMGIVFKHEMRDACKISNESFKIRSNQTTEEITIQKQEEFLSQIEYSLQVSQEWHLRKKLCAVFEREKAYNLLSSYKHCRLEGDIFEMHLTRHVELTSLDRDIILNQVKATHESDDLVTGKSVRVSGLKILMSAPSAKAGSIQAVGQGVVLPAGIWGSIRQALIDYHGKVGEALDRSWFSKLEAEVDEQKKTVKLKAPTEFIKDWINRNYLGVIEKITYDNQYKMFFC
jgi:hypothetical protein